MAASIQGLCLSVCVFVCLTCLVTSSDISFTANPTTVRPLKTRQITLRCGLKQSNNTNNGDHSNVSFVHDLSISKAGVELATVSERLGPKVFDNTTGVQVTGQVPATGDEKGYLQVSWEFPDSRQGGDYRCDIRGMDQHGHVKTFSKSLYVEVKELSINDIVGYIHNLHLTKQKQSETNAALNMKTSETDIKLKLNDMKTTIAGLKASNTNLKTEVKKLNTSKSALQIQVNDLKTKQDKQVIFTAFLKSQVSVSSRKVVVFNKVKTNLGGGYDQSTGVFTSPVKGYFVFDIHLVAQHNKLVKVCILHNNICVAKARASAGNDWQSASNSVSLLLQRGDTVRVVSDSSLTSYFLAENMTTFSGRLLALA